MYENRKIALYIDVDNLGVSFSEYNNALLELEKRGKIIYGKVYGVSERKHKEILESITARGFDLSPVMRIKKRGSHVFDNRIIVDVMESVLQNTNIDTVALLACPTDLVWLYSKLRSYNINIITLDNNDEDNGKLVHEFLDIGLVDKLPSVRTAKPPIAKKAKKEDDIFVSPSFRELLNEQPEVKEEPKSEPKPEPKAEPKPTPKAEPKPVVKPEPKPTPKPEPIPEPIEEPVAEEPVSKEPEIRFAPDNGIQVLKEIDDIQNANKNVNGDDELLAEIRKLIEGFREDN